MALASFIPTVIGIPYRGLPGGDPGLTWNDMVTGNGQGVLSYSFVGPDLAGGLIPWKWQFIGRGKAVFDTSSLSGQTLGTRTAPYISFPDNIGNCQTNSKLVMVQAGGINTVVNSDYQNMTANLISDTVIGLSGIVHGYTAWLLNALGIGLVNFNSYTILGFREQTFDIGDSQPPVQSSIQALITPTLNIYYASIPTVTTSALTNSPFPGVLQLWGTNTDNGDADTISWLDYGLTVSYGSSTLTTSLPGSAPNPTSFMQNSTYLLLGNVVFHYRAVTQNAAGTAYSGDGTVTTLPYASSPTTSTLDYLDLGGGIYRLRGNLIDPGPGYCRSAFDYGTTISYGSSTTWQDTLVSGLFVSDVALSINNYHFRAKSQNNIGTIVYGSDIEINLLNPPTVTTLPATGIS